MDPLNPIRNGFANAAHSHFYAAWGSRHQSSMIPKALKIATVQKKNAPIPPHIPKLLWQTTETSHMCRLLRKVERT